MHYISGIVECSFYICELSLSINCKWQFLCCASIAFSYAGGVTSSISSMWRIRAYVTTLHGRTTLVWVAGCWVQFPNDATYLSAKCVHPYTALLGFFPLGFAFFNKNLYERIKSCNLNKEFCRLRREFNLGPKVLNALVHVILSKKAMSVVLSFPRKPNAKIISFSYDYRQKVAAVNISGK